jgi:hypothetical protein
MKTIRIKKNYEFSPNSKVIIHVGENRTIIKGFESFSFTIEPGQEIYASQLWTKSNMISYDQIDDLSTFVIKPRLGKMLAFIALMVFAACTALFIFTRFRWSYLPLTFIAFYALLYITVLKDRYLIINQTKD